MLYPPHTSLEARTVIRGRNTYHPPTQGRKASLSLNCMFNGRGVYETDEARFAVDDRVFLLLNPGRDYVFGINSDTAVESLSICFPAAYLDQALTALTRRDDDLLANPGAPPPGGNEFFETLYSPDRSLDRSIRRLQRALAAGPLTEPDLGERLRLLAATLLRSVLRLERQADSIDARRPGTRQELVRRLHRGKDYIHAHLGRDLPLQEIAAAAALSPHHFLRCFRAAFGLTPHAYLIEQRLAQARTLLERTDLPVLAVCLRVGFASGPSFSTLFRRRHGVSPLVYRRRRRK